MLLRRARKPRSIARRAVLRAKSSKPKRPARCPISVAPELWHAAARESSADAEVGATQSNSFDGYRVQLRVENGEAVLNTRKCLYWTESSGPSPKRQVAARGVDRRRDRRRARSKWCALIFRAAAAFPPTGRPTTSLCFAFVCGSPVGEGSSLAGPLVSARRHLEKLAGCPEGKKRAISAMRSILRPTARLS